MTAIPPDRPGPGAAARATPRRRARERPAPATPPGVRVVFYLRISSEDDLRPDAGEASEAQAAWIRAHLDAHWPTRGICPVAPDLDASRATERHAARSDGGRTR